MAEAAVAAIAVEQVVATGAEAAAAVAIAAPTQPLKLSLTQIPPPAGESPSDGPLTRSHHTMTVLPSNKAYVLGGVDAHGKLAPLDAHVVTIPDDDPTEPAPPINTAHTSYPPLPAQDPEAPTLVPSPRAQHAACAHGSSHILVHGGRDAQGNAIEEDNCLWRWDTGTLRWDRLRGETPLGISMRPRYGHYLFADEEQGFLIVHGGRGNPEDEAKGLDRETWMYDFTAYAWIRLPDAPAPAKSAAYCSGGKDAALYTITEDEGGSMGGAVQVLRMRESSVEREKKGALVWETVPFPANPLAPGPQVREGAALVPLGTGHGRRYLVYMFGEGGEGPAVKGDVWVLQLPSRSFSAAATKDKIREKLPGMESGTYQWGEGEIVPTEQMAVEGKVHPGPRAWFGAASCLNGRAIVMWGGVNAKGEREGDGWILRLAHGYADHIRSE